MNPFETYLREVKEIIIAKSEVLDVWLSVDSTGFAFTESISGLRGQDRYIYEDRTSKKTFLPIPPTYDERDWISFSRIITYDCPNVYQKIFKESPSQFLNSPHEHHFYVDPYDGFISFVSKVDAHNKDHILHSIDGMIGIMSVEIL